MGIRTSSKATGLLAVALVSAACSINSGGAASGGKGVVASGTFVIDNIDPGSAEGGAAGKELAGQQIYGRLLKPNATGTLQPDLAQSWKANADSTSWEFTLRSGLKFSDGSPLTSADIVDTYQRLMKLNGPSAANFKGVTVKAGSDTTVTFTEKSPDPALPSKLTVLYILPSGVPTDAASYFAKPVGSGPFMVKSFKPSADLTMVPNPNYWGGAPKIKSLTLRSIPDVSARLTALKTGEISAVWGVPDDQLPSLQSDSSLKVQAVPSNANITMWFNSDTPALKSAKVRRALWEAVDYKSIIKQLYPETGQLADSPLASTVFGYAPQSPVPYDPAAAKKALQDAGFSFDKPLRLQFGQAAFKPFLQAVVSDWAKIGVKTDLLQKEQAVFIKDLLALKWDVNFQQLGTAGYDASTNLGRLYPCDAKRNGYCNPDLDKLLTKAGQASDRSQRQQLYAQAEKIIWDDAVGMFPMTAKVAYVWNKNLSGFTLDALGYPDFSKAVLSGS
ncbi:ABC transporter substrate-binding protein [Actinoallomurus iriomotensis]|uniref:ABC transporter substrate-binding protein n=1 Tax=Actinoallomurus iriomotensis TaxID=478107 RepID=A0A9W6W3M9_9ACTN|nr:ABC transporter substrate-binding protein [Actinoallomurus iriomotensis]GLY88131.1 ABC transporter substrate-binding protein [Actinoallomurus iriomotensis]